MKIVESAAVQVQGAGKVPAHREHLDQMRSEVSEARVELQQEEEPFPVLKNRSPETSLRTMTQHHGVGSWKLSIPKLWQRE
jgi:hypothetical protein